MLKVVKVSGHELDDPGWLAALGRAVAAAAGRTVVVHGGGRQINALCAQLGIPVMKINGLRVTTPEVAEVVQMVLTGPVSARIVGALRAAGLHAIGLSGLDGGLLEAAVTNPDLGRVGDITRVRVELLATLLGAGLTPVVAPVCTDSAGSLNVNADQAAAAIAVALHAGELLFVSDVAGVLREGAPEATLDVAEVETRIASTEVKDGMAVKLRAAVRAIAAGVPQVRVGDLSILADPLAGTRVFAGSAAPLPQPA